MTAALCMSALSDDEDCPPLQPTRLSLMSNDDQDDFRRAVTTPAPPTDREPERDRDTQPPGDADAAASRVLQTMLPAADPLGRAPVTLEDTYLDKAIRVVANAGARLAEDKEERRQQHEAVLAAIHRADENASRNYELLRREVVALKRSDVQQDAKIADLRFELAAMRDQLTQAIGRIDALEKRIPHDAAEGQVAPAEPT